MEPHKGNLVDAGGSGVVIHENAVARVDGVGAGAIEARSMASAVTVARSDDDSGGLQLELNQLFCAS